jgi:hypothetical protein
MTTAKKIKILSTQLDKLQVSKEFLDIFHVSHWQTETLEYLRVFFGADSELYKKCKQYNDAVDEEHKTKNYSVGSAMWVLQYTDMLFSAIGVLQHKIYKKSKFVQFLYNIGIPTWLSIVTFFILIAYYVGRWEGIKTGKSLVIAEVVPSSNNVPQNYTADSSKKQTNNTQTQPPSHTDSINK